MESLLSPQVWLSLPKETRAKIADLFGMKKSGGVEVFNGPNGPEVRSDGYSYSDLAAITVERMQQITGSTSDNFYALFKKIVLLVDEESVSVVSVHDAAIEEIEEAILENVEKDMEESEIVFSPETQENIEAIGKVAVEILKDSKTPFCTKCTSKGVRHLKVCPTLHETKTA